jgi:ribosomal RNA assembly protein
MEEVYITKERLGLLKRSQKISANLSRACGCSLTFTEDSVILNGQPYNEYMAKNVITAFGRGFDVADALKLLSDDYYFVSIDLEHDAGNEKRLTMIKARIIGENGRTKTYIESVSRAKISVYGNTVSLIGTIDQINEAETAINTLIDGGTHKLAYIRMEAAHRKHKNKSINPFF